MSFRLLDESSPQQRGIGHYIGRNLVRGAARVGETVLGLPGDLLNAALGATNLGVSAVTGNPSETISETQKGLQDVITSGAIRKNITEQILPKEYTEPQGHAESFYDELVSDIGSLASGKVPLKQSFWRALAGNTSKETIKALGGGEGAQAIAKIGAMTLAGLPGGRKVVEQAAEKNYQTVSNKIKGKYVSADKLYKVAENIHDNAGSAPYSDLIKKQAKHILDSIEERGNKRVISADKAWKSAKDNNKWLRSSNLPDGAESYLVDLVKAGKDVTRDAAKKYKVLDSFNTAEEIYTGLHNRSKIGGFLEKHVRQDSIKNPLTKTLLFSGGLHYLGPTKTLAAVGSAYGAREISRAYDLLSQSPAAMRIYTDILADAFKGNAKTLARNVKLLDNEISKSPSTQGQRFRLLD